ncbi:MAG: BTAD domain-containing putative transcriptional regulator [Gemmatimonadaceae bacterium]
MSSLFSLELLGSAAIVGRDGPVASRAARGHRLALLALLAGARGRALSRDKILGLLWPEADIERGRHLLSDSLYLLRSALGEEAVISAGDVLRLNGDCVSSDVQEFERLLDQRQLEPAVAIYCGPFLDGFHISGAPDFERWVDGERARLGERFAGALQALAEACEAHNEWTAAVGWWRRLSAHDPYSGGNALRLMRALDSSGNRAAALQHARIYSTLLRDEFGAEPDPEVLALIERFRSEPAAPSPAILAGRPAQPATSSEISEVVSSTIDAGITASLEKTRSVSFDSRRPPGLRRYAGGALGLVVALAVGGVFLLQNRGSGSVSEGASGRSIAVLPFVNLSADPENQHFSDGLTEELIGELSRIDGLHVAARTSSFALRDAKLDARAIGDTLGVTTVLEGSIRKEGNRLRASAQIVDAVTGYHIWSQEYDRELRDVFALQDEIARAIAGALAMKLVNVDPVASRTKSLEAYDLYLRGIFLRNRLTRDDLMKSVELFDRAIQIDSTYAAAYAGKATAIGPLIWFRNITRAQGLPPMRAAARRAVELDETLGEAQVALGFVAFLFDWDWSEAERRFGRAIQLNPNDQHAYHMYANYLRAMGRFSEAVAARSRALQLDPLNARTGMLLSHDYLQLGELGSAMQHARRAVELNPVNPLALGIGSDLPHGPGEVFELQGLYDEAVQEYLEVARRRGATAHELAELRTAYNSGGMRAFWRRWLEMDERQSSGSPDPLRVARIYSRIGDADRAIQWLERAYIERIPGVAFVKVDSDLRSLHGAPRVARILREMKLETVAAAKPIPR